VQPFVFRDVRGIGAQTAEILGSGPRSGEDPFVRLTEQPEKASRWNLVGGPGTTAKD
jgi:hypothetical protein